MRNGTYAIVAPLGICVATSALFLTSWTASAEGDVAAGQQVFARCAPCHSATPGQNLVGPSLADVFGRNSGSEPGYSYSAALKSANITWDENTLDQFLSNPAGDVHGTKMFINVPNAADRQNVIAYLKTLK